MGRFQLELTYLYFPHFNNIINRPVDNVITSKGLQDRNIHILDGTTVENKGKLILRMGSGKGSTMRDFIVCTVHLIQTG